MLLRVPLKSGRSWFPLPAKVGAKTPRQLLETPVIAIVLTSEGKVHGAYVTKLKNLGQEIRIARTLLLQGYTITLRPMQAVEVGRKATDGGPQPAVEGAV